jgi:BirA family transcriptional regulator, biotin operon repressor / biotin---[acetyl-CoA-carboxylase] ligase
MRDSREVAFLRELLPIGSVKELPGLFEHGEIRIEEVPRFVARLEQCGFGFHRTKATISLVTEPESLIPEMIMAGLHTKRIGRDVLVFKETSSTNDRARQAGTGGAEEGLVIFAESQTRGRGTQGRKWVSSSGAGLWFSILLRTVVPATDWPLLLKMAAVACAEVVEKRIGKEIRIKAPNDLILNGGKLAGFVLETSNAWDFQVLGIGLNVRSAPVIEAYPTAAIEQFTHGRVAGNALAAELLNQLDEWYVERPFSEISPAFDARI